MRGVAFDRDSDGDGGEGKRVRSRVCVPPAVGVRPGAGRFVLEHGVANCNGFFF